MASEKLMNAMHYVIHHGQGKNIGLTKINKILFFADVSSYDDRKKPVTGGVFVKGHFGPMIDQHRNVLSDLLGHEIIA